MEYDRLIELILEKIHNIRGSRSLSGMLTSDLNMSKASVYRRLHGDVPFTIEELLRLVQKYGISLDELIRSGHAWGNAPHPRETLPRIVGSLDERYGFEKLVVTYICGSLPMALCAGAPALRAFAAFRSKYLSDGFKQTYEQFVQSDPAAGGSSGTLENLRAAVNSVFLLGPRLFDKLVGDLRFFEALGAVTRESAECLREEAADVLKRMGEIAVRGCYPNGNKVELYVTPLGTRRRLHLFPAFGISGLLGLFFRSVRNGGSERRQRPSGRGGQTSGRWSRTGLDADLRL